MKLGKVSLMILTACMLAACGHNSSTHESKVALVKWQEALKAHPEYVQLEQGRKVLADLQTKRQQQAEGALAQMSSLQKLRELRMASQQSYLEADFTTHMVEAREIENARLQKQVQSVEAEVDAFLASRKQAVENTYQLEIFNLRTKLEALKLRPTEREQVEARLAQLQAERGQKLAELEQEKAQLVSERLAPYLAAMQKRMAEQANLQHDKMTQIMQEAAARDEKQLEPAPRALANILQIMDKEIKKQQDKNVELEEKMGHDLRNHIARLATARGYEVVFKEYKVNVKAVDLTEDVIKELRK